ncbi:MAG TPA: hypothetical protein VLT47_13370 [Anaeromyxobacteraceae bacterium]|nr:hypothetical protein [Anaeromyxobacteraceae bacterium]
MFALLAVALAASSPGFAGASLDVRAGGRERSPAIAWRVAADGGLTGSAADPAFDARVTVGPRRGAARALEVEVAWREAIGVERVALRLRLAGAPWAVDRTLRFRAIDAPLRVGRGTPVVVAAGEGLLVAGDGVEGARLQPRRAEGGPAGVEVTLFADDADDRPFATYPVCTDRLDAHAQHGQFAALEHKLPHREAPRRAGERERFSAVLYDLDPDRPARPLVVERWPDGARGAVVFTDHADRSDAGALAAILWGASDAAGTPGRGFLGRGLRLTRSFFVHAPGGGLDDAAAAAAADDLAGAGSEVALHSITDGRDAPPEVRDGLAAAARWSPGTWIDHQPYTNCEAFSSEGWRASGPFGARDELARGGIRWIWAAGDVAGFRAVEVANVLATGPADAASPAIYPFADDPRLWVFQSSMFFASPEALGEALSGLALERLEGERGLFVGHTYLGAGPRETNGATQRERLAVRRAAGGGLEIAPALDEALARIQARVEAGALASLTWAEAGDRLRALGDVRVTYRPDGTAELRNEGDWPLPGLTIGVPEEGLDLTVDGAGPVGRADLPGWSRASFDLPPHGRVTLRASHGGAAGAVVPLP